MNFLDRNTLPRFQERLDLAASELNDAEDIFCKAINELAGRIYVLTNLIPEEDRGKYTEENSFLLINTITTLQTAVASLQSTVLSIQEQKHEEVQEMRDRYLELEKRLNELDDAAARKEDLNVLLYRSGE